MTATILFIIFAAAVLYAYAGYPLLLALLSRGKKTPNTVPDSSDEALPSIAMLIAARNEESIIAEKIENSLGIDYPREKLRIVVVSDGSTDGTDDIVRRYEARGVSLFRVEPRRGKTLARNAAAAAETSEILVMSDANAMYEQNALRKLARHFTDPSVGVVCGELRLLREHGGENLYWRYEKWIKVLEDRFHSIIGANGSIYAIRRSLYEPLPAEVDDDFLEPLHACLDGRRVRYDREASSTERDIKTKNIAREFAAKRRTVLRGIQSLRYLSRTASPFTPPALAFELVSHKIFKWLVPFFLIGLLATTAFMLDRPFFAAIFAAQIIMYGCAIAGVATGRRALYIPTFFAVTNAAVFAAVIEFVAGKRSRTWEKQRS
ncbi:MAG: glycosyltransferase family 2 protein [Candidatus Krumholzibacteria bacterium]|nr:glycosyltransferase family 2 protein [Candidatus Krumholzibacteria bacterium]